MESTKQKKISIIVPVYNVERYLSECLNSILKQTFNNLEIICINDGSTDNSAAILAEFANKDKRITIIQTNNGGVSRARNLGLDIATGDYIGFIDSDDYALPEMYQQMVDLLERNEADVSICSFVNIRNQYQGSDMVMSPKQAIYNMNEGTFFMGHLHNKLYKKELWKDVRLNQDIAICEDLLVNHYIFAKAGRIVFQNLPLYYYRPNENSACRNIILIQNI